MRLVSSFEMRAIESRSGIPEETLMENAGRTAARTIIDKYEKRLSGKIAFLCGPGHNGADGLVIARHLEAAGYRDFVFLFLKKPEECKPLFQAQWERLGKREYRIVDSEVSEKLFGCSVIIDALYGIGLDRPLVGDALDCVHAINSSGSFVISVDVPSGLNIDRGITHGHTVHADVTLTFSIAKVGFFTAEASECVGRLILIPIGIPSRVIRECAKTYKLFGSRAASRVVPQRSKKSNKTTYGHLAVCAGSPGFWGAGILCTQAAFRIGSGYVTWFSHPSPDEQLKSHPEVMTKPLERLNDKDYTALVIGPGLGIDNSIKAIELALRKGKAPMVLDADAITALAQFPRKLPENCVLTPHTGELTRLLKRSSYEIESNRFESARDAAREYGCIVLLKGYRSIVASPDGAKIINAGNEALAKAGTGDVLAGFIGGLMAQGLTPEKAACLGAFVHGRIADDWLRRGKDVSTLVASDLPNDVSRVVREIRKSSG